MRWMAWNVVGGALWLAGLAYAKGMSLISGIGVAFDGHQVLTGFSVGVVGLLLLTWVNLLDVS